MAGLTNEMVELTFKLPENVAQSFGETTESATRHVLESAAVEGYRSGRLSRGQVGEMLQLSWFETEEFLARHDCYRHLTLEDLEEDRRTMAKFPVR